MGGESSGNGLFLTGWNVYQVNVQAVKAAQRDAAVRGEDLGELTIAGTGPGLDENVPGREMPGASD